MLGEIGWEVDGYPVNSDTRAAQGRLNVFYETGIINLLQKRQRLRDYVNVIEIGAGFGDTCLALAKILPSCRIFVCDLPESLLFSATHLQLVMPAAKHFVLGVDGDPQFERPPNGVEFIYVPNYLFGDLADVKIDFAYNVGSFEEMSPETG